MGKGNHPRTSTVELHFYTGTNKKIKKLFKDSNRVKVSNIKEAYLGKPVTLSPIYKDKKANVCFITGGFDQNLLGIDSLVGDEKFDNQMGIMHYFLARDRGFVKTASFVKGSVPRSRELNVASSYSSNQDKAPRTAFWEPFSVNLELFGNPNARYGTLFFVQPTIPGINSFSNKNSVAYKLQIGGYHRMVSIENSVTPEGWTTSIQGEREDPISGKLATPQQKLNSDRFAKTAIS